MSLSFWIEWGWLGMFLSSFLAGTVIPLNSEIVLLALIAIGASPFGIILVATLGNWMGGVTTYFLGLWGSSENLKRYFNVSPEKIKQQQAVIRKWGSTMALLSWVPIIGNILTAALGFYRVSYKKVLVLMLIGKAVRYILLFFGYTYFSNLI
jgi:membrane protein YqaA with SNARE-associated domain